MMVTVVTFFPHMISLFQLTNWLKRDSWTQFGKQVQFFVLINIIWGEFTIVAMVTVLPKAVFLFFFAYSLISAQSSTEGITGQQVQFSTLIDINQLNCCLTYC